MSVPFVQANVSQVYYFELSVYRQEAEKSELVHT